MAVISTTKKESRITARPSTQKLTFLVKTLEEKTCLCNLFKIYKVQPGQQSNSF